MTLKVFICGITGTQGGAIARRLLTTDPSITVHAVARDPTSDAAQEIAALGAKLTEGSYTDEDALRAAMNGCNAAFLNLSPNFTDRDAEMNAAKLIMKVAKESGVKHVLYSSGICSNRPEQLRYWDANSATAVVLLSKKAIENEVRTAGFQYWTILRPAGFMSNYILPLVRMYNGLVENGRWITALQSDSILPLVDFETIGKFGEAALLDPERFNTQEIELADEFLAVRQVLEKLSAATGRDLQAVHMTDEEVDAQKGTNPFIGGQLMMRDMSGFVDLAEVDKWGIERSSLDKFLKRERARLLATYDKRD